MIKMVQTLTVMVGIQGTGKTTVANNTYDNVISSDDLRDECPSYNNQEIFKYLYEKVNSLLYNKEDVCIDATNTTMKMRRNIFDSLDTNELNVEAKCVMTPYNECCMFNKGRRKPVPADVLERYYHNFEVPFKEEGFDKITIMNIVTRDMREYEQKFSVTGPNPLPQVLNQMNVNQQSPHHSETILGHTFTSYNYLLENYPHHSLLLEAMLYHDWGKTKTQTFDDSGVAHYYNHENVSAYDYLSTIYPSTQTNWNSFSEINDIVFYINYHMRPNGWSSTKAKHRWKERFGEEKYNNLLLFNEADRYRKE